MMSQALTLNIRMYNLQNTNNQFKSFQGTETTEKFKFFHQIVQAKFLAFYKIIKIPVQFLFFFAKKILNSSWKHQ